MQLSKDIFEWLDKNKEWFKVSAICKRVKIDKGNFSKYKKEGELPEKFIQPILDVIMPFGFIVKKIEKPKDEKPPPDSSTEIETPAQKIKRLMAENKAKFTTKK